MRLSSWSLENVEYPFITITLGPVRPEEVVLVRITSMDQIDPIYWLNGTTLSFTIFETIQQMINIINKSDIKYN